MADFKLNLKNPLVVFDLETTGINVANDRIVEISVLKVYPNGNKESHNPNPASPFLFIRMVPLHMPSKS